MNSSGDKKRMPVWLMVLLDTGLTAAAIGTFMLFDYVLPQSSGTTGTVVAQVDSSAENNFALPSTTSDSELNSESSSSTGSTTISVTEQDTQTTTTTTDSTKKSHSDKQAVNKYDNEVTDEYSTDTNAVSSITNAAITSTELNHYTSDTADITLFQKSIGEGSDKITYYVSDVYVTNAGVIQTAFANNTYGKNIKSSIYDMSSEHNAVWSINGDFYGNSESGVVIRNGVKYRDNLNDADVCVLFTDGTMKTYSPSEFDSDTVIAEGAWQAWNFGPSLLDGSGNVLSSFNTTTYLNSNNPRSAIGYVEAGHYIFVTVDGRNEGYSRGVNLSELAAIMADEGCQMAYNLDGGKSAMMYYDGSIINQPDGDGREISDIIYIGG